MAPCNGVTEFFDVNEDTFIDIALKYGTPIRSRRNGALVDILTPNISQYVEKDSLSKRYGIDMFPIHTDGAYLKVPPKYIILKYIGDLKFVTPTVVVDFQLEKLSAQELEFIKHKIWFVKGEGSGFYSKIMQDDIIRYDQEVMNLVNPGTNLMEEILRKMDRISIVWEKDKVVVINNHRVLHYRPKVSAKEINKRILKRISVL